MTCIYILPIGSIEKRVLRSIAREMTLKLDYQCTIVQGLEAPSYAFESDRKQYSSSRILKEILKNEQLCSSSESSVKILGIVDVDLCTPILTFVFGEAQLGGIVAIVSLCRLRQTFYGLPPNPELFLERARKEALHELGHTFGLVHCSNPRCVMYFSNSVRNIDTKTKNFCNSCSMLLSEKR